MAAKKQSGKEREISIPDRLYFRIGEVADLCQVPTHVLRFWETEFPQLKPSKSSTGQRMYRRREVELALRIRKLLYEEGYTIAGARQQLKSEAKPAGLQSSLPFPPKSRAGELKRVQQGLKEILVLLNAPVRPKRTRTKPAPEPSQARINS